MKQVECKIKTAYREEELYEVLSKKSGYSKPYYRIVSKSLDARKKSDIHFLIRAEVSDKPFQKASSSLPLRLTKKIKVAVLGLGPAGYYAARQLAEAGAEVCVFEKGPSTQERTQDILNFEKEGKFTENSNYLFGEGGAGTFSDGKLTSRTKSIRSEKEYILNRYINAGAPAEIAYLAKPHIGSNILREMMPRLRAELIENGATIYFNSEITEFSLHNSNKSTQSVEIVTDDYQGEFDYLIVAPGHSSYNSYRMLMKNGVVFRPKLFAVGFRVEHEQELINKAQWGVKKLDALLAAEYRLTFQEDDMRVYSFCMCPGGTVVPAFVSKNRSGVNGASDYERDGEFANSAIVSAFDPRRHLGEKLSPLTLLDYLDAFMEKVATQYSHYSVPGSRIRDFIASKESAKLPSTSYPFPVVPASYSDIFDHFTIQSLRAGLSNFCRKIRGFDTGLILGTELTTSAPLQVLRSKEGLCEGFTRLYVVGEGSGYAGGIISSAADGIKAATDIINRSR